MPKTELVADHQSPLLEQAPAQGHLERRRPEQAIAHWQRSFDELGEILNVETLGFANIKTPDWSHRFVILVDQNDIESSAILLHGSEYMRLMDLSGGRAFRGDVLEAIAQTLSRCIQARLD